MKDLEMLASECEADLSSINIQPGEVNQWLINTRAKNRWGQCKRCLPGIFDISISARHSGYLSNPPAQIQECAAHARTDQQQAGFQNSGKRFVRDRRETV